MLFFLEMIKIIFAPVLSIFNELLLVPATSLWDALIECLAVNNMTTLNIFGVLVVVAIAGEVLGIIFKTLFYAIFNCYLITKEEKREKQEEWKRSERVRIEEQLRGELEFEQMYNKYVAPNTPEVKKCKMIDFPS